MYQCSDCGKIYIKERDFCIECGNTEVNEVTEQECD
jgi:uncharacterized OB-fold protein